MGIGKWRGWKIYAGKGGGAREGLRVET